MEDGLMAAFLFQSKIRTDNNCRCDTIESLIQVFRLAAFASDLIWSTRAINLFQYFREQVSNC